jgi:hypothetical protein
VNLGSAVASRVEPTAVALIDLGGADPRTFSYAGIQQRSDACAAACAADRDRRWVRGWMPAISQRWREQRRLVVLRHSTPRDPPDGRRGALASNHLWVLARSASAFSLRRRGIT